MRLIPLALGLLIFTLINTKSQAQCESLIGPSTVAILGGPGIQVTNSLDVGGSEFDFNTIFTGQAEGPGFVTINNLPSGDPINPVRGLFMTTIDFESLQAPVNQFVLMDNAIPSTQEVRIFKDEVALAATITTTGNPDAEKADSNQIFCSGISNGVVGLYNKFLRYLEVLNTGGSGRVVAKDISKRDDVSYVLLNFQDTIHLTDSIMLISQGGWDGVVVCYDQDNKYVKHEIITSVHDVIMVQLMGSFGVDDEITVSGSVHGTVSASEVELGENLRFGDGGRDIFTAVYSSELEFSEANVWGGASDQTLSAAYRISSNNPSRSNIADIEVQIAITGFFNDSIDLDPGEGEAIYYSNGSRDIFVACYNANLELIWGTTAGSPGLDEGRGVAVDKEGNLYLTGYFSQTIEFTDANPEMRADNCTAVLISKGFTDVPVVIWDQNGLLREGFSFGGSGYDGGNAINVDSFLNVYVGGFFKDTVDFQPGPDENIGISLGMDDAFLVRYPQGCPGGAVPIRYELANIESVGFVGDPMNFADTIETGCFDCELSLFQWTGIIPQFNLPSSCTHLGLKVSSVSTGEAVIYQLSTDIDTCFLPIAGSRQPSLNTGESGALRIEFFEFIDDIPGEADATLDTGVIDFYFCSLPQEQCDLSIDSIVTSECNPLTGLFDLSAYIHYASVLPVLDTFEITTFDSTFSIAADNSGTTIFETSLRSNGSTQSLTVQLVSDTSCSTHIDTAYNAPPECFDQRNIEIDTVIVRECNAQTDSFVLNLVLSYQNPLNQDLLLNVFNREFTYDIDLNGEDTIGATLEANGSKDNPFTLLFSNHSVGDTSVSGFFDAPESCLECMLVFHGVTDIGPCDSIQNTYSVDLDIAYAGQVNEELQISLDTQFFETAVNGSGRDTITLFPIADGSTAVNVLAVFSDDSTCMDIGENAYNAPESCELTSVQDARKLGISWHPVPTRDHLILKFRNNDASRWQITLLDPLGRIADIEETSSDGTNVQLDFQNLAPGFYYIVLDTGEKKVVGKVVKL